MIEQRLNRLAKIRLIHFVDLGRDLERNSELPRDLDGTVRTFFRRDAAKKYRVSSARIVVGLVQVGRDAMVHGGDEIAVCDWSALIVGNRHQRHVAESDVERFEVVQILAPVQRCHGPLGYRPEQWKMKLVDVEMQNVEFICELAHAVEHQHVVGDYIAHIGVETQRLRNASHEIRARH